MKEYLVFLENIPGVLGTLLFLRDGAVVESSLPPGFDADQVRKLGLTLHHGVTGLEEGASRLETLEFSYRQCHVFMWVTADHLLLVLTEKNFNRALLERSVTALWEKLSSKTPDHSASVGAKASQEVSASLSQGDESTGGRKRKFWIPLLSVFLVAVVWWGVHSYRFAPAKEGKGDEAAAVTLFRMQGSNTIGSRLGPALAVAFLKEKGAKGEPVVEKTGEVDTRVTGILKGRPEPVCIEISAHGSGTAFTGLGEKRAQIGMASRPITPEEVKKLSFLGDLRNHEAERVLAMDGLAIIVNPGNKLEQLSNGQIAGLFSGELSDWSQLPDSGLTGPVHIYARDDKSGTYDTLKSLVLKPNGVKLAKTAKRYEDSNRLSREVSKDPRGIGFIGLPFIRPSKAVAVSDTGVRPIFPNSFTVATEDYPLSRRLFLYLPAKTDNLHARDFVSFALSDKGQKVVREMGFIDLVINEEKMGKAAQNSAPDSYRRVTRLANRLSLNFRFLSGSDELDSKGRQDVMRLVEFLKRGGNGGRGIRLLGFADSMGDKDMNCRLSQQRARAVEKFLNKYGIYPLSVDGFCDAMPVASNRNLAGREKNRRVEVWINR